MDKKNRPAQGTAFFQGVPKIEIVIIFKSHSTKNDEVDFSLKGYPGQYLIVGFT
jgi:hypothetical protein